MREVIFLQILSADSKLPLEKRLHQWELALSMWITEAAWFAVIWNRLDRLPMIWVVLLSVGAVFAALAPLTAIGGKVFLCNSALVIAAVVCGSLWLYTNQVHVGLGTVSGTLDRYGFSDLGVRVDYPEWLTADDVGCCEKPIIVFVSGDSLPIMSFETDDEVVYVMDEGCHYSNDPMISTTLPSSRPYVFYVVPRDRIALTSETTTITPQVRSIISGQPVPVAELAFSISLENPAWKVFRDASRDVFGGTTLLALVGIIVGKILGKE